MSFQTLVVHSAPVAGQEAPGIRHPTWQQATRSLWDSVLLTTLLPRRSMQNDVDPTLDAVTMKIPLCNKFWETDLEGKNSDFL